MQIRAYQSSGVLLGRPFLRTAQTIIDVFDGKICLDYHGEKYTFSIDEAMKKPLDVENLHAIDVINPLVQEYLETELMQEQFNNSGLSHSIDKEVAGWCETLLTQDMTDEQINEAIMAFCHQPLSFKPVLLKQRAQTRQPIPGKWQPESWKKILYPGSHHTQEGAEEIARESKVCLHWRG